MSNLTRELLIKTIVAEDMKNCDGGEYTKTLKINYEYWESMTSEDLCNRYNKISKTNVNVDDLNNKY